MSRLLCAAASEGDLNALHTLIDNDIDPDSGDYDQRTAIHVAASEGLLMVVQFLIKCKANINVKDRWGSTPLQDAVLAGHKLVAQLLHEEGGKLMIDDEAGCICTAAAEGAIERIGMLQQCGLDINAGDYDSRTAIAVACAERQALSVFHLLNTAMAEVNVVDRWGSTPLIDALSTREPDIVQIVLAAGGKLNPKALLADKSKQAAHIEYEESHTESAPAADQELGYEDLKKALLTPEQIAMLEAKSDMDVVRKKIKKLENQVVAKEVYPSMLDVDVRISFIHSKTMHVIDHLEEIHLVIDTMPHFLKQLIRGLDAAAVLISKVADLERKRARHDEKKTRKKMKEKMGKQASQSASQAPDAGRKLIDKLLPSFNKCMLTLELAKAPVVAFDQLIRELADPDDLLDSKPTLQEQVHKLLAQMGCVNSPAAMVAKILQDVDRHNRRNNITGKTTQLPMLSLMSSLPFRTLIKDTNTTMGDELFNSMKAVRSMFTLLDMDDSGEISSEEVEKWWAVLKPIVGSNVAFLLGCQDLDDGDHPESTSFEMFASRCVSMMLEDGDDKKLRGAQDFESKADSDSEDSETEAVKIDPNAASTTEEGELDDDDAGEDRWSDLEDLTDAETLEKAGQEEGGWKWDKARAHVRALSTAKPRHNKEASMEKPPDRGFSKLLARFSQSMKELLFDDELENKRWEQENATSKKVVGTLDCRAMFDKADADGSGNVLMKELEGIIETAHPDLARNISVIFEEIDTNGDALITYDEFVKGYRKVISGLNAKKQSFYGIYLMPWLSSIEAGLQVGLPAGVPAMVVSPMAPLRRNWDSFMKCCYIFILFEVPLRVSFGSFERLQWEYYAVCTPVDLALIANVVLNFFTAYKNKKSVLVTDLSKIRRHYLGTKFTIDILCAFPLDLFLFSCTVILRGSKEDPPFELMSWLRTPKLFTIIKLYGLIAGQSKGSNSKTVMGGMQRLMPMLLSICHVLACIWWYIGVQYTGGMGRRWVEFYDGFGTEDIEEQGSIVQQYLLSVYWITTSLSTSGLIGSMFPKNYVEMLFTCVVMMVQLTLFKYVLGEISNLVMEQDAQLVETRRTVHQMASFIEQRQLPQELSSEIISFFDSGSVSKAGGGAEANKEEDIFTLLSRSLQVDVAKHISRALLDNIKMFQSCSSNFLDGLSVMLRETNNPPETYIYNVQDVSREMYILNSGTVELTSTKSEEEGEMVETVIQPGQVFGEVSFLFGMRQTTNARTTQGLAVTFTLLKADFTQMVKLYQDEEENIVKVILNSWNEAAMNKNDGASSTGSESIASALSAASGVDDLDTIKKVLEHAKIKKKNEKIVALVEAASKNEVAEVDRILASGDVSIDDGDYDKRTALHLAACEGHAEMVLKLVQEYGADVDVEDRLGGTPAADALRHKHNHVINILHEHGAQLKLEDPAGRLCSSAAAGDMLELQRLYVHGIDPNLGDYDARTALHLAASNGHLDCVSYLCELPGINLNPVDRKEGTPLQDAVRHNHIEIQALLGKKGATFGDLDVAAQLCQAASTNDVTTLQTFYRCGVDMNSSDYDNRTAMHLAASNGCVEALSWMLQRDGIEVNPVDRLGGTPLEDAYRHDEPVMILMLEAKGGVRKGHPSLEENMRKAAEERAALELKKGKEQVRAMAENTSEMKLLKQCSEWVKQIHSTMQPVLYNLSEMLTILGELLDVHMSADSQWGPVQMAKQKALLTLGGELETTLLQLVRKKGKHGAAMSDQAKATSSLKLIAKHRIVQLFCPQLEHLNETREMSLDTLTYNLREFVKIASKNDCCFENFYSRRQGESDKTWCSGKMSKVTKKLRLDLPTLDNLGNGNDEPAIEDIKGTS
ncbi:hypothetical protein CYMTET_39234 [Cymbomonas tetramitiformis]|uniref:Calmodulin n=1 Tax=Cymbomonas tetramitiformis TaxID=36881 RepID=A0AAE0F4P5_9CHLO|nr:hypothetical protein CYMTET_39234 [Cymbomonas tetramitiformis]